MKVYITLIVIGMALNMNLNAQCPKDRGITISKPEEAEL